MGIINQLIGRFCVVVRADGTSEIKEISSHDKVFEESKAFIGCHWLDHVGVQQVVPKVQLEYLVNDNGYADWGNDPANVNQIATFLYNGGKKPGHYILGNVVFCLEVDGPEGGDFSGMCRELAEQIVIGNNENLLPKAKAIVVKPDRLPEPVFTITSYDSMDELFRAMNGDQTVKPASEKIVSGGGNGDEKTENNQ